MYKKYKNGGFTLVEFLMVLAIMLVLFTILIGTFVSFRNRESLDKDMSLVIETIRQAKHLTLNSKSGNQYGVYIGNDDITLFIGPTYTAGLSTNQVISFNTDVDLYSISLNGGGNIILFKKLTGETDNNGTIILKSKIASTTKNIVVYKTGLVE